MARAVALWPLPFSKSAPPAHRTLAGGPRSTVGACLVADGLFSWRPQRRRRAAMSRSASWCSCLTPGAGTGPAPRRSRPASTSCTATSTRHVACPPCCLQFQQLPPSEHTLASEVLSSAFEEFLRGASSELRGQLAINHLSAARPFPHRRTQPAGHVLHSHPYPRTAFPSRHALAPPPQLVAPHTCKQASHLCRLPNLRPHRHQLLEHAAWSLSMDHAHEHAS